MICQQILEIQALQRKELLSYLLQCKVKIGQFVPQRLGTKIESIWQDGTDFVQSKQKNEQIMKDIEDLKKQIKTLKSKLKDQQTQQQQDQLELKLLLLKGQQIEILNKLTQLESDKQEFIIKDKLFNEEKNCAYNNWPCLSSRYQLVSLLGKGGFSEVYKAFDLKEYKYVAIKMHSINQNWMQEIKESYIKHAIRECQIHQLLKHDNIISLLEILEINNNCFATILEYCEGPDLNYYLKKNKFLQEKEARLIAKQILNVLVYLNQQKKQIIHYDLKPQNIIFHKGVLKITDFGLCKIIENENQTRMELTSQGVGTYWYLPPETFEQHEDKLPQISNKVDIWSFGVIFYEMLFGKRPFGNGMSQDKILKDNIILKSTEVVFPDNFTVSNECKELIKGCLTYNQYDRWDIQKILNCAYMRK